MGIERKGENVAAKRIGLCFTSTTIRANIRANDDL